MATTIVALEVLTSLFAVAMVLPIMGYEKAGEKFGTEKPFVNTVYCGIG